MILNNKQRSFLRTCKVQFKLFVYYQGYQIQNTGDINIVLQWFISDWKLFNSKYQYVVNITKVKKSTLKVLRTKNIEREKIILQHAINEV